MEPSKDVIKVCKNCTHNAPTIDEAPAHCWDCSRNLSLPHWEPIEVHPYALAPEAVPEVMTKQVGGGHYKTQGVFMQPWSIIMAWALGFHRGNVLKYLLRAPQKNGKQDIEKAMHYLEYVHANYDELKEKGLL